MEKTSLKVLTTGDNGVACCGRGLCCENNPGWFAPGEMEKTAAWMGMEPQAFFEKYIVLMSIKLTSVERRPTVNALVPVKVDATGAPQEPTGGPVSRVYHLIKGACVFYKDRRCSIHPVRPMECRGYFCEQDESLNTSHEQIGKLYYDAWKAAQPT